MTKNPTLIFQSSLSKYNAFDMIDYGVRYILVEGSVSSNMTEFDYHIACTLCMLHYESLSRASAMFAQFV